MSKRLMCNGCRNDFYNHNREGGCWSFAGARIRQRMIVGTWEAPPYSWKRLRRHLSCYVPEGQSILEADDCRIKGRENAMTENPPQQTETWKPIFRRVALHRNVLVVAKTRAEGAWAAYCFPVPGINHDEEWQAWKTEGSKLLRQQAEVLFPEFRDLPYAN